MLMSTNAGDFEFQSIQEAVSFIDTLKNENEDIWVSSDEKYPCLAVVIKGNYAAVNYFEHENGHIYLSFNENSQEEITFIAGGEPWTPDANTVIPLHAAISCIKEFLLTEKRPVCIQWQEL